MGSGCGPRRSGSRPVRRLLGQGRPSPGRDERQCVGRKRTCPGADPVTPEHRRRRSGRSGHATERACRGTRGGERLGTIVANPNLKLLHDAGVSIWLDTLSRELLQSGEFAGLIRDYSVTGATSNPTIFAKAITGSDLYDEQLRELSEAGEGDARELFFSLALDD